MENAERLKFYSKPWYYTISFASFVLAVKAMPWIDTKVREYVPLDNEWGLMLTGLIAAWLAAFVIIPELGSYIYWKSQEQNQ